MNKSTSLLQRRITKAFDKKRASSLSKRIGSPPFNAAQSYLCNVRLLYFKPSTRILLFSALKKISLSSCKKVQKVITIK